ncbi:MAG: hypothetical protein IH951_14180 [Bacteroidetes bacterium]|nr:hypothetical protein [Bacteroidota bacterium]
MTSEGDQELERENERHKAERTTLEIELENKLRRAETKKKKDELGGKFNRGPAVWKSMFGPQRSLLFKGVMAVVVAIAFFYFPLLLSFIVLSFFVLWFIDRNR